MFGQKSSDQDFFSAFSRHAAVTAQAAELLVELFEHPERDSLTVAIERQEHEGDKITHDVVRALRGTWITPFDRQDIQNLISRQDDVLDLIHASSKRMSLFEIQEAPDDALALARYILKASGIVKSAVNLLNDLKRNEEILKYCETLNEIENDGDEVFRRSLGRLYKKGNDPLEVMKWREIFENLETALDRCEDVANQIESLVLEYS
jgi:predicted phosphate transport protein (TIGR00153 family)